MTAAHLTDDKNLTITFTTPQVALNFARRARRRGRPVFAHDDRRVLLVGPADRIDAAAVALARLPRVVSVHVEWHLG